ncbi:MAG: VWA domain-containing protein, partial [Chloroflexota bacterium]
MSKYTEIGQGYLLRNIVLFGRMLRTLGMDVTPTQILDIVNSLEHVDLRQRQDVKDTARTILVSHHEHLPLFDQAFDLFWQARDEDELMDISFGDLLQQTQPQAVEKETLPTEDNNSGDDDGPEQESEEPDIETVYTFSAREMLREKDFANLDPSELDEVKRMMQKMEWQLEQRRTRRKTRAPHGTYIDLRRTIRQNLRYGGEPLQLSWRQPKRKRRPLVVISDISGSMDRYSRILLKFIYAISNGLDKVEAFVFSTRLTRVTHQLRNRDIDAAMDQAAAAVHDWGGGTRIGEALRTFNYDWGRRVLGQGAIVLIISDGWDRGDVDLLRHEMARLQLSSQRLIW